MNQHDPLVAYVEIGRSWPSQVVHPNGRHLRGHPRRQPKPSVRVVVREVDLVVPVEMSSGVDFWVLEQPRTSRWLHLVALIASFLSEKADPDCLLSMR